MDTLLCRPNRNLMKRNRKLCLPAVVGTGLISSLMFAWLQIATAATYGIGSCPNDYAECLEQWKIDRIARLRSKEGYLNLVGLYWLKNGINNFGSSSGSDLVFPVFAPADMGAFERGPNGVEMTVKSDVRIRVRGETVRKVQMADDTSSDPAVATYGSLAWTVIRRDNRFAVRLRDFENPALSAFPPIDYYPTDEKLRITAKLQRYDRPRIIRIDTVVEGLDYNPTSPGILHFEIGGQSFELEAYNAGEEFLLVFGDTTSGRETYPAGRFLYTKKPDKDDVVVLDFNTAQNPPCAFNEFATCPIASPRNRLPIPVLAGERFDPLAH
jgi:uncharacterized protein (DUF1684 family)